MAFDALRSTFRRPMAGSTGLADSALVSADPTVDGGTDEQAFNCPACGRTLTRGDRRCDGCGQWLILDVPVRRAAMLSGGGAIAGIVLTVLLVNLFAPPAPPAPAAADPTAAQGPGVGAPALVDIPTGAMAALRGTTAINGRLAAEADPLARALTGKSFRTSEVVKILRRMAIDTRAGAGMLKPMATWPEAAAQQAGLRSFYEDLDRGIESGLAASVNSAGAYKKAAKAILATLGDMPGLDADARALAAQGGLDLPPVTIPAQLR